MRNTIAQIIQQQLEQHHPDLNIHYHPSEAVFTINKPPNLQININLWEDHLSIIARATYITIRYADPELYHKIHTIIAQFTP